MFIHWIANPGTLVKIQHTTPTINLIDNFMQYKKKLFEETLYDCSDLTIFNGDADQVLNNIKEIVTKFKKTHKNLRFQTHQWYEDMSMYLYGSRQETDQEFNKCVKQSETRRLKKLEKDKQIEEKEKAQLAYLSKNILLNKVTLL